MTDRQPIKTWIDIHCPLSSEIWCAGRGDYDLDALVSHGATPEEATQDLLDLED